MKKILVIIYLTIFLSITGKVFSQTNSPSPTIKDASPTAIIKVDEEIQKLKDKIADKVAELRKKDQKAITGITVKVENNMIKINSTEGENLSVKIDDALTKLYQITGSTKKEIKLDNIETDDYLIVTGPLLGTTINANFVYVDERYLVKTGNVTEINKNDYFVKILSSEKDNYTLDIETYTKIQLLNIKTFELEKTGFSKIKEGDTVHFVVKKADEDEEKNRFSAQKILIIPQEFFIK